MMVKKRILIITLFVFFDVIFSGFFFFHTLKMRSFATFVCSSVHDKPSREEAQKCFAKRMEEVGAEMASKNFEVWNKKYDLIQQHIYAHEFGGVLYAHEGTAGLRFCSTNFAYGCFHELTGRAIHVEGLGILSSLNESCIKNLGTHALGCQHGIGHGIQAALGYEEKDFLKALSICRGLRYNDSISGCYAGAIMEYNMRTILSVEGGSPRPLIAGKEDLCAMLDKEYRPTCYYQIPQWWFYVLRNKGVFEDETFAKIGDLCRKAVKDGEERCFRGIGNITSFAALPGFERPITICKNISMGDHAAFKYCVEDVANGFNVDPGTRKYIPNICGVLRSKEVEECENRLRFDPKFIF